MITFVKKIRLNMRNQMTLFPKLLLLLLCTLTTIGVQAQGMDFFHGSWEEAKAMAKKEKKHIVVDAYASWCGPCKKMARTTFKNAVVGEFYNENYVNFKIDMEKGEGPSLKNVFMVRAFPTIIYYNPEGEEVRRFKGFRPAEDFLLEGKKALVNKEELAEMKKTYEEGKKDPDFLKKYIEFLSYADQPKEEVVNTYLKTQSKKQLKNEKNMQLFYELANGIKDPFFQIMMDNQESYQEKFGKEETVKHFRNIAIKSFQKSLEKKDENLFKDVLGVVEKLDFERKELLLLQMELEYHKKMQDWEKYAEIASTKIDDIEIDNSGFLNDVAWRFYLNIEDKAKLEKAEAWSKKSVALKSEYHNNDTLAAILFKLGKIEEGHKVALGAIEMAKKKRQNFKGTQDLIDKYVK